MPFFEEPIGYQVFPKRECSVFQFDSITKTILCYLGDFFATGCKTRYFVVHCSDASITSSSSFLNKSFTKLATQPVCSTACSADFLFFVFYWKQIVLLLPLTPYNLEVSPKQMVQQIRFVEIFTTIFSKFCTKSPAEYNPKANFLH